MTRLIPAEVVQPETAADDPWIGRLLGSQLGARDTPEVVMLGFPSDEGVRRNGGRVGAALGPAAIRSALYWLAPDTRSPRFDELLSRTRDLGDVAVSGDVEMDQQRLGEVLKSSIEAEAPDVSAPDAGGLSSDLWIEAAYQAGRSPAVSSADIVELNPAVDWDGQTARLAAVTVWWLLRGRSERH